MTTKQSHIWSTPGNDKLTFHCHHCGGLLTLALPVSIDEMSAAAQAFIERHRACEVPRRDDVAPAPPQPSEPKP